MDRKQKKPETMKGRCLPLYSSSSSSSSWMAGAAERPPGNCLRDVLPSIVSPKVSAGCGGCKPLDPDPFPRELFPTPSHWGETFLFFEDRFVTLEEVEKVGGSLKKPPAGEGLGDCMAELCRSADPIVDGS